MWVCLRMGSSNAIRHRRNPGEKDLELIWAISNRNENDGKAKSPKKRSGKKKLIQKSLSQKKQDWTKMSHKTWAKKNKIDRLSPENPSAAQLTARWPLPSSSWHSAAPAASVPWLVAPPRRVFCGMMSLEPRSISVPSGKHTKSYGKSPLSIAFCMFTRGYQ